MKNFFLISAMLLFAMSFYAIDIGDYYETNGLLYKNISTLYIYVSLKDEGNGSKYTPDKNLFIQELSKKYEKNTKIKIVLKFPKLTLDTERLITVELLHLGRKEQEIDEYTIINIKTLRSVYDQKNKSNALALMKEAQDIMTTNHSGGEKDQIAFLLGRDIPREIDDIKF